MLRRPGEAGLSRDEAAGGWNLRLFPITRAEALRRVGDCLQHRLGVFAPTRTRCSRERWLAHSLLDPSLVVEQGRRRGTTPP